MTELYPNDSDKFAIAIIGLAGRFPQANTLKAFWENLKEGKEAISFFSDEELLREGIEEKTLKDENYVKAKGIVAGVDLFDAAFFDINPKEAEIIDPQHRLFLECAWEALENAGYVSSTYQGAIGVYAGASPNTYIISHFLDKYSKIRAIDTYQLMLGNESAYLPTRVSYKLNLTGPSLNIQTACSTSLVTVHLATQSLLNGECDLALAGGVSLSFPHKSGYQYQQGMIMSPDGHCRAFDADAKGTIGGEGVGIVVLKRLEEAMMDGDHIWAILRGSAINNDGSLKVGYTAPSIEGQAAVIAEAQSLAGVEAETLSYIETHGTGTILGDPIEIAALTKAFRRQTQKKKFCAIGSLKTNIGHADAAAGIAGLIKTVLALKYRLIPPSLNFEHPNPEIDFDNSPFFVNTALREWKTEGIPRRAGVSSFGIGGTNAHAILEEAPNRPPSGRSRPWQLLVLSAKNPSSLETATLNLGEYLTENPELNLADVVYTQSLGRHEFKYRRLLVTNDLNEAAMILKTGDLQKLWTQVSEGKTRPVFYMFSGQGSQYVNMALDLYNHEPTFQETVDHCSSLLKPSLGIDLGKILYPSPEKGTNTTEQIKQTAIAQPTLFVIEYAMARLWQEWGIEPDGMIGHSIGEYVAACLAGVLSLEDALSLVALRGKMMQQMPKGEMLGVPLSPQEVEVFLNSEVSLAVINNPSLCVLSGTLTAIQALETQLSQQGIESRRLHTSHAFHSAMMDPILEDFRAEVSQISLQTPQIPYISNVTGTWITAEQATDPNYWTKHLRQTVLFSQGLEELLKTPDGIFLELGPGRALSTLVLRHPQKQPEQIVLNSLRHPQQEQSDVAFVLSSLGRLWLSGVKVDWSGFYRHERRYRVPLPSYAFDRQRYWLDTHPSPESPATSENDTVAVPSPPKPSFYNRPNLPNAYVPPQEDLEKTLVTLWQDLLGIEPIGIHDHFLELGGHSLLGTQMISRLREEFKIELSLKNLLEKPTIAQLGEYIQTLTWVMSGQGNSSQVSEDREEIEL